MLNTLIIEIYSTIWNILEPILNWLWNDATTAQIILLIYADYSLSKAFRRARRQLRTLLQRELNTIRRSFERQKEWVQKRRLKNVYDLIIKEKQQD